MVSANQPRMQGYPCTLDKPLTSLRSRGTSLAGCTGTRQRPRAAPTRQRPRAAPPSGHHTPSTPFPRRRRTHPPGRGGSSRTRPPSHPPRRSPGPPLGSVPTQCCTTHVPHGQGVALCYWYIHVYARGIHTYIPEA